MTGGCTPSGKGSYRVTVPRPRSTSASYPRPVALSRRLRNASLTEFVFTRDRITLDGFNAAPHLDEPRLGTYR